MEAALDLAENCYEAHLRAPNQVRREFNQAFFERITVDWDGDVSGDLAEPFAIIMDSSGSEPTEDKLATPPNQIALRRMDWAQGSS